LPFDLPECVVGEIQRRGEEKNGGYDVLGCDKGHLCNLNQKAKISIKKSQDPGFLKNAFL